VVDARVEKDLQLDCLTGPRKRSATDGRRREWVDHASIAKHETPVERWEAWMALFGSLAPGGASLKRLGRRRRLLEGEGKRWCSPRSTTCGADRRSPRSRQGRRLFGAAERGAVLGSCMPEAATAIPKKLQRRRQGHVRLSVRDEQRLGTVILHVPRLGVRSPLAFCPQRHDASGCR